MTRRLLKTLTLLALVALAATAVPTSAQVPDPADRARGAVQEPKPLPLSHGANAYSVTYGPAVGFHDLYAGGTGLRNSGTGVITVPGLVGPALRAYLYWVIQEPVPLPASQIALLNGFPVVGTLIGSDVDLCWGAGWAWAYRADVTGLVTGPGPHLVTTISGDVTGLDPFVYGSIPPMAEGASIVAVGVTFNGVVREVVLVDGFESAIGTTASALVPRATPTDARGVLTVLGADGQTEFVEETFWNGFSLGVGTWDGSDPQLPPPYSMGNLWDTDFFDVHVIPGVNKVAVTGYDDCVGPVAFGLSAPV